MLLQDTTHKLNEAGFFLVKAKSSLTNPEELSFYLSAFVSAGRSVTWAMQKEFGDNPGYLIWYEEKQKQLRNDRVFTIFKDLRNITVKEGKLEFKRRINVLINEKISIGDSVSFKVIRNGKVIRESKPQEHAVEVTDSEKNSAGVTEPDKVEVILDDAPGTEGIELCNQYLKRLRTLVDDAENMIIE